jgi:hypothetical protein
MPILPSIRFLYGLCPYYQVCTVGPRGPESLGANEGLYLYPHSAQRRAIQHLRTAARLTFPGVCARARKLVTASMGKRPH